jgi:hypothetical protein
MSAMKLPMKLYKYKALRPFKHVVDIIRKNRFHAAQFYDLNDPMEGLFMYEQGVRQEYLEKIKWHKEQLRVCAFSKDPGEPVLWAHYADGFKGICIEIEVTQADGQDYRFVEVDYSPTRIRLNNNVVGSFTGMARLLLTHKADNWQIEDEVRALAGGTYIPIRDGVKMTRILLGLRIDPELQKKISQITPAHVQVWTTKIGEHENKIEVDEEVPPAEVGV